MAEDVVVGTETGDKITTHLNLADANGQPVAGSRPLFAYLSDTEGGKVVTAAPSGGWSNGVKGLVCSLSIGKVAYFLTDENGALDIEVTHVGVRTLYIILCFPSGESQAIKLVFA